ncbi:MAG: serpin family protein [Oscillospiraceae bacterium]|nr:serpin family protein [Oscillospiraceae bacterium]
MADVFASPFNEQTQKDINNWCNVKTLGMIPELLSEPIPEEAVMYLINAVCFDAKWAHVYEEEPQPLDFTAADGTVQQAQMMYSDEYQYLEDAHAVGFLKYYRGGSYAFAALLPEEGMTPERYLAQLTPDALRDILVNAESCDVNAGLPQFSYDFDMLMNEPLTEMGMGSAFEESADFSNMAKTATGTLFINRVLHKTHIDVDTEGTKAAAVTAVEMFDECDAEEPAEPKYVILDRPFVYMIVDTQTMLPVFFGILNNVE